MIEKAFKTTVNTLLAILFLAIVALPATTSGWLSVSKDNATQFPQTSNVLPAATKPVSSSLEIEEELKEMDEFFDVILEELEATESSAEDR